MTGTPLLAVKATAKEHYALRHPSGDGLDAHGHGHWPDDAFTERRRQEGAIRIGHDEQPAAPKRKATRKSARKATPAKEPAPAPAPATPQPAPAPAPLSMSAAPSPLKAEEH